MDSHTAAQQLKHKTQSTHSPAHFPLENWTQALLTGFEVAQGAGVMMGGLAALCDGGRENLCPVSGGEEQ